MYGQNLNMLANSQSAVAKHLLEESSMLVKEKVGADMFSAPIMEAKMEKDAIFLTSLISESSEQDKDTYFKHLQLLIESTDKLYKEVDLKPRSFSQAIQLNNEITESSLLSIYNKHFSEKINKDFSQPLTEGSLIENNKENAKIILESTLHAGIAKEVDAELFVKYSLFENTLINTIKGVMVPEELNESIQRFINSQDEEYFTIFEENAVKILDDINENSMILGSLLAPKLFAESCDVDIKDLKKYQYSSAIFLKNK